MENSNLMKNSNYAMNQINGLIDYWTAYMMNPSEMTDEELEKFKNRLNNLKESIEIVNDKLKDISYIIK